MGGAAAGAMGFPAYKKEKKNWRAIKPFFDVVNGRGNEDEVTLLSSLVDGSPNPLHVATRDVGHELQLPGLKTVFVLIKINPGGSKVYVIKNSAKHQAFNKERQTRHLQEEDRVLDQQARDKVAAATEEHFRRERLSHLNDEDEKNRPGPVAYPRLPQVSPNSRISDVADDVDTGVSPEVLKALTDVKPWVLAYLHQTRDFTLFQKDSREEKCLKKLLVDPNISKHLRDDTIQKEDLQRIMRETDLGQHYRFRTPQPHTRRRLNQDVRTPIDKLVELLNTEHDSHSQESSVT